MIFATLYCLGLRVGEICRLCLDDVNLEQGLLLIRRSKFYKSRLLPLGPRLLARLTGFIEFRRSLPDGNRGDAPLFASRHGRPVRRHALGHILRSIIAEMGLVPEPGQMRPCLHSFRHSFAVNRLLRWYREGEDVRGKLPFLSAFMGHVDIGSTEVYLREADGLVEEAGHRFEARFGSHYLKEGGHFHEGD